MLNRKLLEILACLTSYQHHRLRQFLNSPFFNNARNADKLIELYDYIIRYKADENHPKLAKQVVFARFFPEKEFVENEKNILDSSTTQLLNLVRQFIAHMRFLKQDFEFSVNMAMTDFYQENALEERFWQTIKQLRLDLSGNSTLDADYYRKIVQVEYKIGEFMWEFSSYDKNANLELADRNLDLNYAIQKLEYACAMFYKKQLTELPADPENALLRAVLEQSKPNGTLDSPVLSLFAAVFNLITNPQKEEPFITYEQLLNQYKSVVSPALLPGFHSYYRYFWLSKFVDTGGLEVKQQLFNLYREHYDKGYLYFRGKIPVGIYRMLIVSGLKLGHFDWVESMLDSYDPEKISGTRFPLEFKSLNVAEYLFYKKEYALASQNIVYKHFENPNFYLFADLLQIKIYFETNDDLLESRLNALDQKVRRTKMSAEHKQRYYNFLRKLDKVIRYRHNLKSPQVAKLVEQIKKEQVIIEREWLLEKLKP